LGRRSKTQKLSENQKYYADFFWIETAFIDRKNAHFIHWKASLWRIYITFRI